jgi:hypothetical protein
MEAELRSDLLRQRAPAAGVLGVRDDWREVVFSVPRARRALRYVSAIARDAARAFNTARRCRELLQRPLSPRRRDRLCLCRDRAIHRLDLAIDECNLVGAHLFNLEIASVSLQGHVCGRSACLLWTDGDAIHRAWADLPE